MFLYYRFFFIYNGKTIDFSFNSSTTYLRFCHRFPEMEKITQVANNLSAAIIETIVSNVIWWIKGFQTEYIIRNKM